jgi:hypothetical protein
VVEAKQALMKPTNKGKLTISTVYGGESGRFIMLTLTDGDNLIRLAEIRMSVENFALAAICSMGNMPCKFEIGNVDLIGARLEVKHEVVILDTAGLAYNSDQRREAARAAIAPFEIDGWSARLDDVLNHHNVVKSEGVYISHVRVAFTRYVHDS